MNQLVKNSIWSQKGNFCDIPTDCPTRERESWTGDMGVFIESALTLMNCYPVVGKWLDECRLDQCMGGCMANIAPPNTQTWLYDPNAMYVGRVGQRSHSGAVCLVRAQG